MDKFILMDWNGDQLATGNTEQEVLKLAKDSIEEDGSWDEDNPIFVYELKSKFRVEGVGVRLVRVKI